MNRSIEYKVFSKFIDDWVVKIKMPYNPFKSLSGYYSNFWKKMKPVIADAENAHINNIYLKKTIKKEITQRITFEWPSGIRLDMPADATAYDYKIVIAQIEVLRMRFNK